MLSTDSHKKITIAVTMLGTFATAANTHANLLVNPDFSSGATGFSSSYVLASDLTPTRTYAVSNNPQTVHPTTGADFGDHTTGSGLMLIANGATTPVPVWQQTVTVSPNTNYALTGWAAAWDSINILSPASLEFRINASTIGSPFTVQTLAGNWSQFSFPWNAAASTSALITITDLTTAATGNDFVLDDLSFVAVPELSMASKASLAVAGFLLGRRRQT